MIYRPQSGSMWDPSVLWYDGMYYAVMMYSPKGGNIFMNSSQVFVATSPDGVHWTDGWVAVDERAHEPDTVLYKPQLRHVGDRFFMNQGVLHPGGVQDMLRFYESRDLKHWTHLGNSTPDPRWYVTGKDGRWDHMYVLPKEEGNPAAGYWGYLVATTQPGEPRGLGMMESADGLHWQTLPPPVVEWGDIPQANLEIGGCERIGGKYVVIGGWYRYLSEGYAMYTLVGDSPTGPFRPDRECFRLCGNSNNAVAFLACWARGKDGELLICNYAGGFEDAAMLPLRKPVFADGHLRLGWWPGNEALKGEPLPLPERVTVTGRAWLVPRFDWQHGIVLEGAVTGPFGIALEEVPGIAMEIRLTECATLMGRANAVTGFAIEDTTGPGCATVAGCAAGVTHRFRLLLRGKLFELYLDDLLAQTYRWRPGGGRIGLLAGGATTAFRDLRAYQMTIEGIKP